MAWTSRFAAALVMLLGLQTAFAAVSVEEAKRLGGDLTPMGAEKAGNAAGTIPAWDGGLSAAPPGVTLDPGKHLPDPFAADQPLYTISGANMAQFEAQLTEGHKALLSAYPESYFMKVYPTRRSCAYPPQIYKAVQSNAVNARLTDNGNGITGATMASPFPIPQSAREILWNNELGYRGASVKRESVSAAPTKGGDFEPEITQDQLIYLYSNPALASTGDLQNVIFQFLKVNVSPPSKAGLMALNYNTLNQVAEERRFWIYQPGQRKVKRLAGGVTSYDSLSPDSEGIRTNDTVVVFTGAADRYDWELLGKQEKLIAYNSFQFASPEHAYKDILHGYHLNPELMRYELHRVWVVEGKLRPGKAHSIAARRRMYIDEDSWLPVATGLYDGAGGLARVQEGYVSNFYDQPLCVLGADVIYDINGGRYHVMGLRNQQKPVEFNADIDPELLTPGGMRRLGVR
ncbi:MAG: DUF1329 domain-containing protein [Alphaproteobacteria bacterium]